MFLLSALNLTKNDICFKAKIYFSQENLSLILRLYFSCNTFFICHRDSLSFYLISVLKLIWIKIRPPWFQKLINMAFLIFQSKTGFCRNWKNIILGKFVTMPTHQLTHPTQFAHTLWLFTVSSLVRNWHPRKAHTITHL